MWSQFPPELYNSVQSLCISFPVVLTINHTFPEPRHTRECTVTVQGGVLPGDPHKLRGVRAPRHIS